MARWGVGEPDAAGVYRTYNWPRWYDEYRRIRDDSSARGVSAHDVWAHAAERWDTAVLPDLGRYFGVDTSDEAALYARPWWWLRSHVQALFGIQGSLTGATFTREDTEENE